MCRFPERRKPPRPFLGNIGTMPSRDIPDSHNCADFGQYLINAPHRFGMTRAAKVTGLPYDEVLNRATITGSIDISRLPGTVRVTFLCPMDMLDRIGIGHLVREKYDLA
jgi:hypothetical protein